MSGGAMVPEALHVCPACQQEVVDSEHRWCEECRQWNEGIDARFHARRTDALFSALPRETGRMPEATRATGEWFVAATRLVVCAVAGVYGVVLMWLTADMLRSLAVGLVKVWR